MPIALYEVGIAFQQGWGVKKDLIKAAYYLCIAAELGDVDAQISMADCFLRGDGVKKSKKQAAFWLRKAGKQGANLIQSHWIWKQKYD